MTASTREVFPKAAAVPAKLGPGAWVALFILTTVYALNIADRYVVSTLVEPIKHEFGLSDGEVGLLTGAALAIFYVAAGIPIGVLADRHNRKRIVMAAVTLWSVFTALCGMSSTYWQLLLARVGVGVGEAGGTPPSQSMLSDYFLPSYRSFAMSIFAVGASVGAAIGSVLGGQLTGAFGWRGTLLMLGCLGIPVVLLLLFLREPQRGLLDIQRPDAPASVTTVLRFVGKQRSLLHMLAAGTLVTYWGWGMIWWTPAFLQRSFGLSTIAVGDTLGWMHGIGGTVATLGTAWSMKWLARRAVSQQARFLAIVTALSVIPSVTAYATQSPMMTFVSLWLFLPLTYVYIGPTLALTQNLVPATMRSLTSAMFLFACNIANLLLAPLVIGALSDFIAPMITDPKESLRYALLITSVTGLWAAYHFHAATRGLHEDLVRAGTEKAP